MKEIKTDRTGWDPGPWDSEPDRLFWQHAGFDCLICRNSLGNLCGYVGVQDGHPWFDQDYDNVDAVAHGGLTYSGRSNEYIGNDNPETWWVGFDCAHLMDLVPGMEASSKRLGLRRVPSEWVYRDLAYVKAEVECLAEQAREHERLANSKLTKLKRMFAFGRE